MILKNNGLSHGLRTSLENCVLVQNDRLCLDGPLVSHFVDLHLKSVSTQRSQVILN